MLLVILVLWRCVASVITDTERKLLERFTKNNCKKASQKEFRVEKVIKRKGDMLYVK